DSYHPIAELKTNTIIIPPLSDLFSKNTAITASLAFSSIVFAQKMPMSVLPSGHLMVGAEVDRKKGKFYI
ncbi:hypothetical protein DBR28_11195, partial [Chryseobacterium sp. HMWF028]